MVKKRLKFPIVTFFVLFSLLLHSQTQTIYISEYGTGDYKSLKEAHDAIEQPLNKNLEIRIIGKVPLISDSPEVSKKNTNFKWTKTGNDKFSITITSDNSTNLGTITRPTDPMFLSPQYMIHFTNVQNMHWENIIIENSTIGFQLDNVDNSSFFRCIFKGDDIFYDEIFQESGACGGATLWIGANDPTQVSENNTFTENVIYGGSIGAKLSSLRYHGIYVSYRSKNVIIKNNTIHNDRTGTGIAFNHGFQENIHVVNNFINKIHLDRPEEYSHGDTVNDCRGNPTRTYRVGEDGVDNYERSKNTINLNIQASDGLAPDVTKNNEIVENYTYSNRRITKPLAFEDNDNLVVLTGLIEHNTIKNNHASYGKKITDPYWVEDFNPKNITGRVVSGDFDGDGKHDDVAAFYKSGNSKTEIRVWLGREDGSFQYFGENNSWWNSSGYNADKITGRIVSGDFDNDGKHDDIAALYDYGDNKTRIHVFLSDGKKFNYSGQSRGWWISSGYNANKVTGRIVSGDFDNDGFHDDIATFYNYGGSQTRIHIFRSYIGRFYFSSSQGWWKSYGYVADRITDKIVSGDFDRDGYHDDIAAFYDYGGSQTRIHTWIQERKGIPIFKYSGGSGWWKSMGYVTKKITGRIASGDFDGDGYHNDITAFYDYRSRGTRIHKFSAFYNNFFYSGSKGAWIDTKYNATKITGRIVAGDFNNDEKRGDLLGFYNYEGNRTRTHTWHRNTNQFELLNGNSGAPWATNYEEDFEVEESFSNASIIDTSKEESISKIANINTGLNVYPNPVSSQRTLNFQFEVTDNSQPVEIIFTDLNGNTIETFSMKTNLGINSGTIHLARRNLRKGVYILTLKSAKEIKTKRVILI